MPHRLMSPDDSPRQRLLARTADHAARVWADHCMNAIRAEGRALAGGWPGTISEARGWSSAELAGHGLHATHDELDWLARTTYARAREVWLAGAASDEEDLEATG
jgi:hypothetical protein